MGAVDQELEDLILDSSPRFGVCSVMLCFLICVYVYCCFPSWSAFFFGPKELVLIDYGAISTRHVDDGERWRLIYGLFLHADALHLTLNCMALWILGNLGEAIYGPIRLMWILIISGICGACLSWGFGTPQTVGFSGAIFGLLGAEVVYGWRHRSLLSLDLGQALRRKLLFLGVANIALGFVVPVVDNASHIGGLIGGVVIGAIIGDRWTGYSEVTSFVLVLVLLLLLGSVIL